MTPQQQSEALSGEGHGSPNEHTKPKESHALSRHDEVKMRFL